jgi:acyl transferase domain-containing protein
LDLFDHSFFRIAFIEACTMDPQQKLLLEVGYDAFYAAGYTKSQLSGFTSAVYVGCGGPVFGLTAVQDSSPTDATGVSSAIFANQALYFLGLGGVSASIGVVCFVGSVSCRMACGDLQ